MFRIEFALLDVLHVLCKAVQDLGSVVGVKDVLGMSLDVASACAVSELLLLSALLRLLFCADSTHT